MDICQLECTQVFSKLHDTLIGALNVPIPHYFFRKMIPSDLVLSQLELRHEGRYMTLKASPESFSVQ